ncbi:MAG: hypothetical protein K9M54_03515 [Kiritimatiellales bacterium]|nr:hypothetical protein [Kiritimatiellales bacterium]
MRKKTLRRPIKKPALKRRRVMEQRKRLEGAGMSAEKLIHMDTKQIRAAIRATGA